MIIKRLSIKKLLALCLLIPACSSISTKDLERFSELEGYTYVMRKDITVNERTLAKNQLVKIIIARGDDNVKVYAYPASVDVLKADRVLLLYLFDDDFPEADSSDGFDFDFFLKTINELITRK
jgi:type II secretion system-associated lipoprotein